MRLSELATKQLIDMREGKKYGILDHCECVIDPKNGKIIGFQMKEMPSMFKQKREGKFIAWEHITLVGKDRVLFTDVEGEKEH